MYEQNAIVHMKQNFAQLDWNVCCSIAGNLSGTILQVQGRPAEKNQGRSTKMSES